MAITTGDTGPAFMPSFGCNERERGSAVNRHVARAIRAADADMDIVHIGSYDTVTAVVREIDAMVAFYDVLSVHDYEVTRAFETTDGTHALFKVEPA